MMTTTMMAMVMLTMTTTIMLGVRSDEVGTDAELAGT